MGRWWGVSASLLEKASAATPPARKGKWAEAYEVFRVLMGRKFTAEQAVIWMIGEGAVKLKAKGAEAQMKERTTVVLALRMRWQREQKRNQREVKAPT